MSSKEKKLRVNTEGKIKIPLSLALLVYSIIVSSLTGTIVAMAMLMAFCGDICLMKYGNCFYNKCPKDFGIGVMMFMTSHAGYAHCMETTVQHIIVPIIVIITVVYAMAITAGMNNKIAVSAIYVIVLILSVINTYHFNAIAFIGGVLFLVSDFAIGIFDIIKNRSLLRHIVVWGTYVPAQILMLTSFII